MGQPKSKECIKLHYFRSALGENKFELSIFSLETKYATVWVNHPNICGCLGKNYHRQKDFAMF
jgi:hypothetical protein